MIITDYYMKQTLLQIYRFYIDGFRGMTLGRTLWMIILIKLFIMFFVLRIFFFPRFLSSSFVGDDKSKYVGKELIDRSAVNDRNNMDENN